jgi:hypothetical protein
MDWIAEKSKDIFDRHVKVVIDEEEKFAANAVFFGPPQAVYGLERIVKVLVNEVELKGEENSLIKGVEIK